MKKTPFTLHLSLWFAIFTLVPACNHQDAGDPQGWLSGHSGCKGGAASGGAVSSTRAANSQECILYRYSGRTLFLSHQNAAFNCCPGEIEADIVIRGETITIRESEREAGCHCQCLYDLEMEVAYLRSGTYRIVIESPYLEGQAALDFVVDLEKTGHGEFCLQRNGYPWNGLTQVK